MTIPEEQYHIQGIITKKQNIDIIAIGSLKF